jgi:hypothetical protein
MEHPHPGACQQWRRHIDPAHHPAARVLHHARRAVYRACRRAE